MRGLEGSESPLSALLLSTKDISGMLGPESAEKRIRWALDGISQAKCSGPTEAKREARKITDLAGMAYVDLRILTALALDLTAEALSAAGHLATTATWYLLKASERLSQFD